MLNLIKYEFIRKYRSLLMFLALALGLNVGILFKLRLGSSLPVEGQLMALFVFFGGMLLAFFLFFIINVTVMYSKDLYHKSGYMFFLTPHSGYSILGAKILTGILEGLLFLIMYIVLLSINFFGLYGNPLSSLLSSEMYSKAITEFHLNGVSFAPFIALSLLVAFVSIVTLVLTIFAGISIGKSILAEKKFGTLLSFLSVFLLGWINGQATHGIQSILGYTGLLQSNYSSLISYMVIQIGFGAIFFTLSAYLLEKRIDL